MTDNENHPIQPAENEPAAAEKTNGQSGAVAETAGNLTALQQEALEARSKANEYLEGWQRARAEFANYKKRVERDQSLAYQNAAGSILKRYLEVIDDMERALKNRPQSGEGVAWSEGVELIYRKLLNLLDSEGVKPMQTAGQVFDPTQHEAITLEDNPDYESGQIIEVVQQGYLLGERVLRPALVRVAK